MRLELLMGLFIGEFSICKKSVRELLSKDKNFLRQEMNEQRKKMDEINVDNIDFSGLGSRGICFFMFLGSHYRWFITETISLLEDKKMVSEFLSDKFENIIEKYGATITLAMLHFFVSMKDYRRAKLVVETYGALELDIKARVKNL